MKKLIFGIMTLTTGVHLAAAPARAEAFRCEGPHGLGYSLQVSIRSGADGSRTARLEAGHLFSHIVYPDLKVVKGPYRSVRLRVEEAGFREFTVLTLFPSGGRSYDAFFQEEPNSAKIEMECEQEQGS